MCHHLALKLNNFVAEIQVFAAISNYSIFPYLTYSTLHCRYSKDIARQPLDNCGCKDRSLTFFSWSKLFGANQVMNKPCSFLNSYSSVRPHPSYGD